MTAWLVVPLVVMAAVLLVAVPWLSWTANRLDRMHHRVDVGRERLDGTLLRRSGAVLELAASDALDPASRLVLLDAAHRARNAGPQDFEAAESALSETLRAVLGDRADVVLLCEDQDLAPLVDEVAEDCARVELARRVLNAAVAMARELRSRRRVRWFRLAGRAQEPLAVDLDDALPRGLAGG